MTKQEYLNEIIFAAHNTFPVYKIEKDLCNTKICAYRTEDGRKCIAGILIPDNMYKRYFEGQRAKHLFESSKIPVPDGITIYDIQYLQSMHDSYVDENKEWDAEKFLKSVKDTDIFDDCIWPN